MRAHPSLPVIGSRPAPAPLLWVPASVSPAWPRPGKVFITGIPMARAEAFNLVPLKGAELGCSSAPHAPARARSCLWLFRAAVVPQAKGRGRAPAASCTPASREGKEGGLSRACNPQLPSDDALQTLVERGDPPAAPGAAAAAASSSGSEPQGYWAPGKCERLAFPQDLSRAPFPPRARSPSTRESLCQVTARCSPHSRLENPPPAPH